MSTPQSPTEAPTFRDQSIGLIIFGIFQILLGCFFGMMSLMMALFAILGPPANQIPQGEMMQKQAIIPALVIYLAMAGALLWLGIGSIRARR